MACGLRCTREERLFSGGGQRHIMLPEKKKKKKKKKEDEEKEERERDKEAGKRLKVQQIQLVALP